jgi:hypothetical protein
VAAFPTVPTVELQKAVTAYLAAALPARERVALPDKDVSVELRVDTVKYRFIALDDHGLSGAAKVTDDELGLSLIVAPYGAGGSSLATSPDHIKAVLEEREGSSAGRCAAPRAASSLDIRLPVAGYRRIFIVSLNDSLISACGYRDGAVENY